MQQLLKMSKKLEWMLCVLYAVLGLSDSRRPGQYELMQDLFRDYRPKIRPVAAGKPGHTVITLDPALYNVIDLNENQQVFSYTHWYRMWMDPLLTWDPSNYSGIAVLKVPTNMVWMPDITNVETVKIVSEMPEHETHIVKLHSDGLVTYARAQTLNTHCVLHLALYPFDQQNCTQYYVSWLYTGAGIAIFPKRPADSNYYRESTEWHLVSYTPRNKTTVYKISATVYYDVFYDIVIRRKSFFYIGNFVLPTCAITALTVIGLFSPFNNLGERQEKVTMGLTSLLTLSFLLLMIQVEMPTTDYVPLLGLYEMLEMYLAAVATVFAVGMMYLHHRLEDGKVPRWLCCFVGKTGDKVACSAKETEDETLHVKETSDRPLLKTLHPDFVKVERFTEEILNTITVFKQKLHELVSKQENMLKCRLLCYQTDKYLMVFFHVINVLLTSAFLLIGHFAS